MRKDGCGPDSSDSGQGKMTGCCKHGNEPSESPTMKWISWIADLYWLPPPWHISPQWAKASSLSRLHDRRHTTISRTPLDEWSARRREIYPTTHNTHKRQTSMTPAGFKTRNPSKQATAYPGLRPPGHWDRLSMQSVNTKLLVMVFATAQPCWPVVNNLSFVWEMSVKLAQTMGIVWNYIIIILLYLNFIVAKWHCLKIKQSLLLARYQ